MSWPVHVMCSFVLLGCATTSAAPRDATRLPARTDRYTWVDAHCSDGTIDLAGVGFERTVDVERRMDSVLLTFDTALATEGCRSLSVWTARREPKQLYLYSLVPEAWVELPVGNVCGEQERATTLGELHFAGDTLEIITQRSPWCRGYDAHFIYRAMPHAPLDGRELVARYVAHFSRGDAGALAAMFESRGALIESFSSTPDGQPTRHEGRAAIRAYFERVFASARWHAARLIALSPGEGDNVIIADLEYMDSELSEPLRVRSSFVLAAGEIFESDTQLVTDPKPAPAVPAQAGPAEPKS
jgi:ketosteroid isomerase-like protein